MENQFEPFGPEWEKEMMNFTKAQLITMIKRLHQGYPPDGFVSLFAHHGEFSDKTFGENRDCHGPINHLKKEVEELSASPFDREEYADCLLLLMDAFRRSGGSAADLVVAGFLKLEKNKKRKWGKPDENGVVEHIKDKGI